MARLDPRALLLVPVLLLAGCGGDDDATPAVPTPTPAASSAAAPAAEPSEAEPTDELEPSSDYVEEDKDPTEDAGDLPGEAQDNLDEALGIELGALEGAPPAEAKSRRATLDKLPENPTQVLAALKDYKWLSPEAKAAYERAVAAR